MQRREKSSYPLSSSKPVVKMMNYKQSQWVDVLSVPRALVECGSKKGSFTINVRGRFDFQDFFNPLPHNGNVRKKMSTPQLMSAN